MTYILVYNLVYCLTENSEEDMRHLVCANWILQWAVELGKFHLRHSLMDPSATNNTIIENL